MKKNSKWQQTVLLTCFSVALYLMGMEIALRVQQKLGPFFNLHDPEFLTGYAQPSNLLNHVHKRRTGDGINYDEYGIRVNKLYPYELHTNKRKVLFLGDSFMDGFDDPNTLTTHLHRRFERTLPGNNLALLNAGCASYSAVSYAIQARHLLDVVKATDLVVNIDESDLHGDNNAKAQIVRDYHGKIVAQIASPKADILERLSHQMQKEPFYLQRFIHRIFTTQALFPLVDGLYEKDNKEDQFYLSRETEENARKLYSDDLAFFRQNLEELAFNIKNAKYPPRSVTFAQHPHLQHMVAQKNGRVWNRLIAASVKDVAERHGFYYYDGLANLQAASKGNPQQFYIPGDMHLNFQGLWTYAQGLGRFMEAHLYSKNSAQRQLSSAPD